MVTLKDAAQQALEALMDFNYEGACEKEITALRTALAEQPAEQEPVQETAWQALPAGPIKVLHQCRAALIGPVADGLARRCAVAAIDAELAQPAQQQEPVAFLVEGLHENVVIAHQIYFTVDEAKRTAAVFAQHYPTVNTKPLYTSPQASKPLTDERPVSNADELPNGFVPLQKENGRIVYAACMDSSARHYKWLMWKHPDGQWVSKRKLEDWEVMQVEDQEYYGIVQEAAHGIKGKNNG